MALLILANDYMSNEQPASQDHAIEGLITVYNKYTHLHQQLLVTTIDVVEAQKQFQEYLTIFQNTQSSFIKKRTVSQQETLQCAHDQSEKSSIISLEQQKIALKRQASDLYAICLAPFELRRANIPLELCANRNGQAIFRYLVTQENRSATTDTLMTLLWPNDPTDIALNKLYIASVSYAALSKRVVVSASLLMKETNTSSTSKVSINSIPRFPGLDPLRWIW